MDSKQVNQEMLFSCEGWQACTRMGYLTEMHHILMGNYKELMKLLKEVAFSEAPGKEVFYSEDDRLKRYIFNFFMSTTALRDACRLIMKSYKNTVLEQEYKDKIKIFHCDLVRFIEGLRNYQAHRHPIMPDLSDDKGEAGEWKVIFSTETFLKEHFDWSAGARSYMQLCGKEIPVDKVCCEYHNLLNEFYYWLYQRLQQYHQKDLEEKERLIDDLNLRPEMDATSKIMLSK